MFYSGPPTAEKYIISFESARYFTRLPKPLTSPLTFYSRSKSRYHHLRSSPARSHIFYIYIYIYCSIPKRRLPLPLVAPDISNLEFLFLLFLFNSATFALRDIMSLWIFITRKEILVFNKPRKSRREYHGSASSPRHQGLRHSSEHNLSRS